MADPAFLYTSAQLGDRLLRLYSHDCPKSKEFQYMGREIKAFHSSYQIVRPYLHGLSLFISDAGSELVHNVQDGIGMICEDLSEKVRTLQEQLDEATRRHHGYFMPIYSLGRARSKRIQNFFERNNYSLERAQVRYGNMLLKLILAVLVYAQYIHEAHPADNFPDASNYLVTDLYLALGDIRRKEARAKRKRRTSALPVEASWWWDGLSHQPNMERVTPLEELARIWVNPEARLAAQPTAQAHEFQMIIQQLRSQNEQQRTRIRELSAENQQQSTRIRELSEENQRQTAKTTDLRQLVDDLRRDVQDLITELRNERNNRQQQERSTNRYRAERDHLQAKYDALLSENQNFGRKSGRARREQDEVSRNPQGGVRERNRSSQRDLSPRPPRTMRPSNQRDQGPPVSFDNLRRCRRSSSGSHRSHRSSGSSIVIGEDSGRYRSSGSQTPPPPVIRHTRPWPSD
ncbi:hypothetical protein K469DRAFT_237204 [Zopfia rhizophila CBS 207.26]|uniref:Uncharacterized protein n=1 Tax=Zopfia rhizophila CBS 207.26 TaxID=1314779 RepID=A0A6A6ERT6_9PEZI|nr:hypothetical protein K469DRAFT_237204 [Zopfia rhizophila CBS 207.26]